MVLTTVIVIVMVSVLLPASVAIRLTTYSLLVPSSTGFSKSVAALKAMRQVSPSTLLGVKSAASAPLSVQPPELGSGSVLSASARL